MAPNHVAQCQQEPDKLPQRDHQRLNVLLDAPAAAEAYPVLVARLRRVRDGRQEVRRAAREDAPDFPN